ncbi:MAG TPA: alpha/beta hydrolase [Sphingorhabdus sp.]|jgi:pimeloyl-ACP methyl ester carboxylesterase|uniref:alpha/beta fold hydrolase n=1 Tax=Sphingorhabdus sp. TaxID=1902408 RepID=UPI00261B04EA|nr:alpha/beta hydrolase [Sphingorhabdus sp.]HMS19808.1 alpha/beta hydrolase [Sphingorhabdus sp.]HMT40290.1 alpha/beta hydrolase [Sphingorhabdus sp.]HMU23335.1 alpha/beta hydrolase [Sphingorhabdus sp.]
MFVDSGGIAIAASRIGEDSRRGPVILAHGGGQTKRTWRKTMHMLEQQGFCSIAIDMRGHGESEWAPPDQYRFADFGKDILAVCDTLDERPHVIGASLGGLAALVAEGALRPGSFASLTLVDVTPEMAPDGVSRIVGFMSAHIESGFTSLEEAAEAIGNYLPNRPKRGASEGLKSYLRLGPDNRYRWHWDPGFLSRINDRREHDYALAKAAAGNLSLPVHLVRGGASDLISLEAAERFINFVSGAHFTDVSGAGHMVVGDDNDVFSRAIIDFLEVQDKLREAV